MVVVSSGGMPKLVEVGVDLWQRRGEGTNRNGAWIIAQRFHCGCGINQRGIRIINIQAEIRSRSVVASVVVVVVLVVPIIAVSQLLGRLLTTFVS